jgi:peptidoglycan-associated lipoprotein
VACSSTKPTPTPAPAPTNNSTSKPAATTTTASSAAAASTSANSMSSADAAATAKLADEIQKIQPGSDAASAANLAAEIMKLHKESVYFDYDKYDLKPEFRNIVDMQAASFKSRKNTALVLEGNADERGSAAYNMALGEKRANSVKKALVILGVPASKVKVVSFGNTRPKLACHEEKCWEENRRVDFVFKQK